MITFFNKIDEFQQKLQMSQYYRPQHVGFNQFPRQVSQAQSNSRGFNRTFGSESPKFSMAFSHPQPSHVINRIQSPTPIYHEPVQPLEMRPVSQSSLISNAQNIQEKRNQFMKQTFQTMAKSFMTQMTKSINQIAKAQVEAIMTQKQKQKWPQPTITVNHLIGQSRKLGKFNKNQEGETKSSTYNRVMSLQQSIKEDKKIYELQNHLMDLEQERKKANMSYLRSNSVSENQNTSISNQVSEVLKGQLKEITKEMKNLGENKKQQRTIWLDIDIEKVPDENKSTRIHHLKKRVFKIMEDVLSVSFNMHYTNGMDYEKVKAYCCENFIANFCKLVKIAKITIKDMKTLEQKLQADVLPYLNLSYPRSEQKLANKQLKSKISQKDIFNENRFDIVSNSKVTLSTKQSELNSQIMKILNYIIQLPDQKVSEKIYNETKFSYSRSKTLLQEDQLTLYEHFDKDMEAILTKVYRKDLTDRLYKMNSSDEIFVKLQLIKGKMKDKKTSDSMKIIDQLLINPNFDFQKKWQFQDPKERKKIETWEESKHASTFTFFKEQKARIASKQIQKQKEHQEQQYKEKVQSYTKFKIGRKISSNVQPYTEQQIEQGALIIKDSSVARVLMKWAEALEDQIKDPAKSLYLRDEPFRLHDQQQTYLLSTQSKIKELYQFYRRSCKVIQQKSEVLKNNARQIFLEAIKAAQENEKFKSYRQFSSENDSQVGHICTVLLKSRENHVSSYLNMLLGQIKYIQQEYQWQIEDKRIQLPSRPSFINMKLGDLMRCQITSKPKQIVALYQYIYLICKLNPQKFQLVRVKDRSSTPNKDILINIFYHKKIMIEIQLAIKNQSAFISCSDRFSHFIYQLERALLGPINEMCSIWSQYSPKSQFFVQKFSEINVRSKKLNQIELQCMHFYEDQDKDLKLPFRCFSCGVLYYNGSTPRKKCTNCSIYQCCICTIKSNETEFIKKQIPEYEIKKDREIGKIFYALDIMTTHRHLKAMLKLEINGELQAYSLKLEIHDKEISISSIKSEYKIGRRNKSNFKKQLFQQTHIILQKKDRKKQEQQNQLVDEVIKQILTQYYLPRRMKVIIKKSQSFMKLTLITNPKISDQTKGSIITDMIKKHTKLLTHIQKLNLNESGLSELNIAGKMENAKSIVLNHNAISKLQLHGLKNLEALEVSYNKIQSISDLKNLNFCWKLKRLMLDNNFIFSIKELPASLVQLEVLSLCRNRIKSLKDIPKFENLRSLNLNENQLLNLVGIEKLTELVELRLKQNCKLASSGVEEIKDLKNLKKLDLSQTNLRKTLGQSVLMLANTMEITRFNVMSKDEGQKDYEPLHAIRSLQQIQQLDASFNELTYVPKIPEFRNLRELNLSNNRLKSTKNLQDFAELKWLCLKQNQIKDIELLDKLKNLYWLDLSRNQITSSSLPIISRLKNLHEIQLSNNQLDTLEGIGCLPKLYEFSFRHNKITSLKGIQKLISLEHLDAKSNRIQNTFGTENLQLLFELKLSGNKIKNLSSLIQNQRIKILELNNCEISSVNIIPRLKNLQQLYLNSNKISKLEGIKNFESLKKLQILLNEDLFFNESDFQKLQNLSNISFTLNQRLNLSFIGHSESLDVIRIHKKEEPTADQNNNLITFSLLGFNIYFIEVKEPPKIVMGMQDSLSLGGPSVRLS